LRVYDAEFIIKRIFSILTRKSIGFSMLEKHFLRVKSAFFSLAMKMRPGAAFFYG